VRKRSAKATAAPAEEAPIAGGEPEEAA
jgi:hypothetical protein